MKYINLFLVMILIFSMFAGHADAQKVIKKTVKKVVTPQIAPAEPPAEEPSPEVTEELPPPPPPPVSIEVEVLEEDQGLFGWGINTDIGGKLLYGSVLFGVRGDLIFADPLLIGEKIGLAEDAVEYRLGTGFAMSDKLKTIPLFMDAVVYLKEGSLFGMDSFIGSGLIFNLYGTGPQSGGLGGQIYLGILADLGLDSRTGINLGYAGYNVGSSLSDSGIFVSLSQPLKL